MVRRRLKILALLVVCPFLLILGRLGELQLLPASHARFARLAQHQARSFEAPERGEIISSDGQLLAANRRTFQLHFDYRELNPRAEPLAVLEAELRRGAPFQGLDELEARLLETADPQALAVLPDAEGGEAPSSWLPFLANVPCAVATNLERRWRRHRAFFQVRSTAGGEAAEVWARPRRLLTLEITLHRLTALLAASGRGGDSYQALRARVEEVLAKIDLYAEKEVGADRRGRVREAAVELKKRNIRRLYYQQSWLLCVDVPMSVVTEIEYRPELYPGIHVTDAIELEYPLKEACGTLVGHLRRLPEEEQARLRESGRLLELFPDGLSTEDFALLRPQALRPADLVGSGGLEEFYDEELRGLYGMRVASADKFNRPREVLEALPAQNGATLHASLQASLQLLLYEALSQGVKPAGGPGAGDAASAVVMDLKSGGLLAAVGFPGIDPNRMREPGYQQSLEERWGGQTRGYFLDRPSRHTLFPGSIFKLVVAAAAMESAKPWRGAFSPERRYPCNGAFDLLKGLHCASTHGSVDLVEALQHSCNNYFYYLGYKHLGAGLLYPWARNFGYGSRTGIDLPAPGPDQGTGDGALQPPDRVTSPAAVCHLAIGQVYVEASPLQVLRSVAAVALGGTRLPRPHLVRSLLPDEPLPLRNPGTAAALRQGMWQVGHAPGGTAANPEFGLNRFRAGFKTGSAEIRKEPPLHHAWIVGFAPFEAPRIAFVVVIEGTPLTGGQACSGVVVKLLEHFARADPEAFLLDAGREGIEPLNGGGKLE